MTRKFWIISQYIGQPARVRLVDYSSRGWGHINFDDLKGAISCEITKSKGIYSIIAAFLLLICNRGFVKKKT